MRVAAQISPPEAFVSATVVEVLYRLAAGGEPENGGTEEARRRPIPVEREDLPYRVELWDANKKQSNRCWPSPPTPAFGYAAYFAATREFADRYITLRHRNRFVSRWNAPGQ